jgi:hypothetical protein
MTHRVLDRVQETTTSTGTGALTLAGAVTKMLSFSGAGLADGDTFWGLIEHATANEWEITLCTFHSAGNVTRATPRKSSTGAAVAFSAGTKTISLVSLALAGVRETVLSPAISAGALSLDLAACSNFMVALNGAATVTFDNAATGYSNAFTLQFTADGTPRAITWPVSVTWPFGAPTLSSTNARRDLFSFTSFDGGTTWLGFVVAQNY